MRTRFKSLLALGLTFAAGCFVGIVIGTQQPALVQIVPAGLRAPTGRSNT